MHLHTHTHTKQTALRWSCFSSTTLTVFCVPRWSKCDCVLQWFMRRQKKDVCVCVWTGRKHYSSKWYFLSRYLICCAFILLRIWWPDCSLLYTIWRHPAVMECCTKASVTLKFEPFSWSNLYFAHSVGDSLIYPACHQGPQDLQNKRSWWCNAK